MPKIIELWRKGGYDLNRLWVCFKCLECFDPLKAIQCPECGWMICPNCKACLCSLSKEAQITAIVVYISHAPIPVEEKLWWYNRAKEIAGLKPKTSEVG